MDCSVWLLDRFGVRNYVLIGLCAIFMLCCIQFVGFLDVRFNVMRREVSINNEHNAELNAILDKLNKIGVSK